MHGACCSIRLHSPASIERACDQLEELVKLRPRLIQVRSTDCMLSRTLCQSMCHSTVLMVCFVVFKSTHAYACKAFPCGLLGKSCLIPMQPK